MHAPSFGALSLLLAIVGWVSVSGCAGVFTLSEPSGDDAYLDAMAAAKRHHHHARYDEAAQAFARAADVARRRVDREEAAYREAKALERAGRPDEALPILESIARARPVARRTARAGYDACLLRVERAPPVRAPEVERDCLPPIVLAHPETGPGKLALRRVLLAFEREGDADGELAYVRDLEGPLGESSLGDNLLEVQAELLLARGDRHGARAALERIVTEHPYPEGHLWDDAKLRLARMDVEDGAYEDAVRRLSEMLARRETTPMVGSYTLPTFPEAQLLLARIERHHLGRLRRAERAYETLADDYETSLLRDDALLELGEMWLEAGKRDRGCRALRRVVAEFEVGHARRRAEERLGQDCSEGHGRP